MKKQKKIQNISATKSEKKSVSPWYKDPKIMVPSIVVIIGAIISAPWWSDLLIHPQEESPSDTFNNQQLETETVWKQFQEDLDNFQQLREDHLEERFNQLELKINTIMKQLNIPQPSKDISGRRIFDD